MNDLTINDNINPLDIVNNLNNDVEAIKKAKEAAAPKWIPQLNVAYGSSKSVNEDKIARPGDFVLGGGVCLGSKIEAVVLSFRDRASVIDSKNNYKTVESAYAVKGSSEEDTKAFTAFLKKEKELPSYQKIDSGIEFFLFIPEQNSFCTLWCKRTLTSSVPALINAGLGRLISISTVFVKSKNNFYVLDVRPTLRALKGSNLNFEGITLEKNIVLPADLFNKYYNMFINPPKALKDAEEEEVER